MCTYGLPRMYVRFQGEKSKTKWKKTCFNHTSLLLPYFTTTTFAHPRLAALSQGGASVVYEVVHSRLLRHPVPVPSVSVNQRWATLGPAEIARIRQVGFRKQKRYTSIVH